MSSVKAFGREGLIHSTIYNTYTITEYKYNNDKETGCNFTDHEI
jgi:hypothetical protein